MSLPVSPTSPKPAFSDLEKLGCPLNVVPERDNYWRISPNLKQECRSKECEPQRPGNGLSRLMHAGTCGANQSTRRDNVSSGNGLFTPSHIFLPSWPKCAAIRRLWW